MAFVDIALAAGTAVGLEGTAAVIGGGAMIGGGAGGIYGALTGGNILNSMLTGALLGGGGAYGAGALGLGGAGVQSAMAGPFWGAPAAIGTSAAPAATAVSNVPALDAAAKGVNPIINQMASGQGAAAASNASNPSWWSALSPKEKLGYGLAGTTAMSLLGGMNQPKFDNSSDKGTIRPYTYQTAQTTDESGQPRYFQPVQYNLNGSTTQPLNTAEIDYFNQGYTALPTYKAAAGGEVPPQLNNMAPGGLAAIEGMRDGYDPITTSTGDIPQMANGGPIAFSNEGQVKSDDYISDLADQLRKLRYLNVQLEPQIQELANQKLQYEGNGQMPDRAIMQKLAMSQPDSLRGIGAAPMGMVESSQMMDRMNSMYGGQPKDVALIPYSLDPKNLAGSAAINKQLDEDTRLKLMAAGHKGQFGQGIDRIGAGISRQLGRDADISGYYERTPGFGNSMMGVKYNQRFAGGGELGGYSDGGRMLKGPGDGMSDSIPGTINNKQPARLADGEFVVPADVVSHLGNGSTDAGAKRLYDMMDRVRKARTGTKKQGKQIKADKYLPK